MAQVENRSSRILTPASGTAPATQAYPQGTAISQNPNSLGVVPDIKKLNNIIAARTSVPRSILSRTAGNVAEIVVSGIHGTPNDLVNRVLEHEPLVALLN